MAGEERRGRGRRGGNRGLGGRGAACRDPGRQAVGPGRGADRCPRARGCLGAGRGRRGRAGASLTAPGLRGETAPGGP